MSEATTYRIDPAHRHQFNKDSRRAALDRLADKDLNFICMDRGVAYVLEDAVLSAAIQLLNEHPDAWNLVREQIVLAAREEDEQGREI